MEKSIESGRTAPNCWKGLPLKLAIDRDRGTAIEEREDEGVRE